MYIPNTSKSIKIDWVQVGIAGILWCSCGKDNSFKLTNIVRCKECGKTYNLSENREYLNKVNI